MSATRTGQSAAEPELAAAESQPAAAESQPAAAEPQPSAAEPQPSAAEPAATDPLARLGQSFKATMGAVRRLRGRETQHLDKLTFAQYGLLFGLAAEPELSASKLAGVADLAPATVTQMLDHLEQVELVRRVRSELDKRVVLVSLTDRGRALVQDRRLLLERRWQVAMAEFSEEELLTAAAVLDRLRDLFEDLERD